MADNRKECCRCPENLYRDQAEENGRPGLTCLRCKVCNARHFEMQADKGVLFSKGKSIGAASMKLKELRKLRDLLVKRGWLAEVRALDDLAKSMGVDLAEGGHL